MKNKKKISKFKRILNAFFGFSEEDQNDSMTPMSDDSEFNDIYLFDFLNYQSSYGGPGGINILSSGVLSMDPDSNGDDSVSKKIKVKPIDVLNELETVPTPFTLALIDEKIEILKDKSELITQKYAKREVDALLFRMQNRKKYVNFKKFFDSFQNTTDEKIDALLSKYDLVMKTSDIFVPEFPDDAIAIMKKYTTEMKKLCDKKPIFYVIAEEDKFRKVYEKRDPILLAQSPFGFYWQILGAWDKEMLILGEL